MTVNMDSACRTEVVELHRFFEDWFAGRIANDEGELARFGGVLAAGFEIITPEGELRSRQDILEAVRGGHGANRDPGERFRIWIEEYRGRALSADVHVCTYQEWQEKPGLLRARLSTALFRRRAATPNGVEWVHVHEVWLPEFPQRT